MRFHENKIFWKPISAVDNNVAQWTEEGYSFASPIQFWYLVKKPAILSSWRFQIEFRMHVKIGVDTHQLWLGLECHAMCEAPLKVLLSFRSEHNPVIHCRSLYVAWYYVAWQRLIPSCHKALCVNDDEQHADRKKERTAGIVKGKDR